MDYSVMPAGAAGKLTNQPVSVPEEDARRYRNGEMRKCLSFLALLVLCNLPPIKSLRVTFRSDLQ